MDGEWLAVLTYFKYAYAIGLYYHLFVIIDALDTSPVFYKYAASTAIKGSGIVKLLRKKKNIRNQSSHHLFDQPRKSELKIAYIRLVIS